MLIPPGLLKQLNIIMAFVRCSTIKYSPRRYKMILKFILENMLLAAVFFFYAESIRTLFVCYWTESGAVGFFFLHHCVPSPPSSSIPSILWKLLFQWSTHKIIFLSFSFINPTSPPSLHHTHSHTPSISYTIRSQCARNNYHQLLWQLFNILNCSNICATTISCYVSASNSCRVQRPTFAGNPQPSYRLLFIIVCVCSKVWFRRKFPNRYSSSSSSSAAEAYMRSQVAESIRPNMSTIWIMHLNFSILWL